MDSVKKLSTEAQVILGCGVVYLLFSFFNWQQVSLSFVTVGKSEWSGIGIVAGLVAVLVLAVEVVRMFSIEVPLGGLSVGLVSVGVALLLTLLTVITFLTHSTARHWPAWIGLILSIAIGAAALSRARSEGVQMPQMSSAGGGTPPSPESTPEAPSAPEE